MADKTTKFSKEDVENVKDFSDAFKNVNKEVDELFSGLNSIGDEIKGQVQGYQLANKAVNNLTSVFGKLKDIQENIKTTNSKDLKSLQEKALSEKKNLVESQRLLQVKATTFGLTEKEVATLANVNGLLETQEGLYQNIEDTLNQIVQNEQIVETTMGNLGALTEGFSSGLKKAGLGALDTRLGLGDALQKTKDMVIAGEGNVSNLEASKFLAKELGTNLIKSVDAASLMAGGVKLMADALKSVDSLAGDTAKKFNLSYNEASQLNNQLTNTAALSMDAAVNTKGLNESMMAVGKTLGSNAKLNDADLITFTKLREQAGYTNDELASIQTLSLANGKSLEDNTAEILGGAQAYASQNKLIVNEKEVLKEVGKASASLKLSLGGSASALAESVVKAKQFGLNLEQASKISSGLLNFEDSISSELEAELLTGKDLNLEQARLLALNGDIAGAAAEVAKQVGSSADFGKMNVIQQEAIAKSVGMSRDELAQSLIDKEALNKLSGVEGKDAKEKFDNLVKQVGMEEAKKRLGNDQLANQFKQQSAQEKMANMASKMQEIFIAIAEPIMAIVSPLIGLATKILPAINAILLPITFTLQKIGEGFQNAFEISKAILDPTKSLKDTFKELGVLGSILGGVFTIIALPIELISKGFENISKMISSVMDPTKTLLDTFKEMGPVASFIATALGAAGIAVATVLLPGLISSAAAAVMALGPMIATAMAAMSAAIAGTLGIGAIPIIAGIAAVAGTIAAVTSLSDGIVDPKGGLVVSGEKGTYKLDENDSIVAGTDINKPKKSTSTSSSSSSPQIDLSPLMERINVLIDAVKAGGDVYLDATKVGTAMNVGTYKVQ
jgi:hypothetical protein